ncbi:MAG: LCP family protein [Chloroflexi bacterium]|nr:LCP family protein [Chloroflexota bacterium]
MSKSPSPRRKATTSHNYWLWALVLVFLIAASITAFLVFSAMRDAVASLWTAPSELIISETGPTLIPVAENALDLTMPLQPENGPPPQPWDGEGRVTLLLLGVDYRDWEADNGPPLTDTIILITIDPQSRTVGMLSIPRDLWVEIPGFGYHKINQAYQLGEASQPAGGGAGLAIATVEQFLDIDIQFYAQIDFNAFIHLIDEIGGVKIEVPETIEIDPLGDNNTKVLQPGLQTLPGDLALAYARARNTSGSDFDRAQRQQQVIMGVRERVISFEILPTLLTKAPTIYGEISNGAKTNLNLQQVIQLTWLTYQIPEENIRREIIGVNQVIFATSAQGMSILQPIPEEIFELRDKIFSTEPAPNPTIVAETSSDAHVAEENARVSILNGTFTIGLAARTDEYLQDNNINITDVSNADQVYANTTIIDYSGRPYTVAFLAELLGVPQSKIYQRFDPASEADITVILGEDWAENNPMP